MEGSHEHITFTIMTSYNLPAKEKKMNSDMIVLS
jgi:hypothetical protein